MQALNRYIFPLRLRESRQISVELVNNHFFFLSASAVPNLVVHVFLATSPLPSPKNQFYLLYRYLEGLFTTVVPQPITLQNKTKIPLLHNLFLDLYLHKPNIELECLAERILQTL